MVSRMLRSLGASGALACLTAFSGCGGSDGPPPLSGDHAFTLVYSQSNFGNIEPCACNNRTTGGFPRRASFLKAVREKGRPTLVVDAGNSLFPESGHPMAGAQYREKAKAIAQAFVATGLDAYVFGDVDIRAAGGNFLRKLVQETGLPVLAANVIDRKTGEPVFQEYKVFDLGGVKLALIGLVQPELRPMIAERNEQGVKLFKAAPQAILLEEFFEDRDVRIDDPVEVANRLLPKLREEAHLIAVLSHMPPRASRQFDKMAADVDFVIGSHKPSNRATYHVQDDMLYAVAPMNGTSLGVIDFDVRNGSLVFEDRTILENERKILPQLEQWRDEIVRDYHTDDPAQLSTIDPTAGEKLESFLTKIAEYHQNIAAAEASVASNFRQYAVTLDGVEHKDDPEMAAFVRNYRQSLAGLYAASDTTRSPEIDPVPGSPSFIGGNRCAECHRPQHEFWQQTRHAHAWQTMLDQGAEYDLECITCHTVGYLQRGGYDRPDRVGDFKDVQCENCHGMGSAHASGFGFLEEDKILSFAEDMACEKCHNSEHSPDFRRDTYVARVSCPPVDPRDPLIRGIYAKAGEMLKGKLQRADAPLKVYTARIDLELRLERYDEALAVAEQGLQHYQGARMLEISAARALDGLGRSGEGLQRLYALYERYNTDAVILKELIHLLLHARDHDVRNPAAADALIEWGMAHHGKTDMALHRYFAESLHAKGRIDQAITVLQDIIAKSGGRGAGNVELLTAWTAEKEAREEFLMPPPLDVPPVTAQ